MQIYQTNEATIDAMLAEGRFNIAPGPFGGLQVLKGPPELAETADKPFIPQVTPDPRTGGFLQLTEDEWKTLGLGAAPSKLEYEGGILRMRDTLGNLAPVKDIM